MPSWYARNRNYLREIIAANGELVGRGKRGEIKKLVGDIALYQQNEDGIKVLQPVATAIDAVYGNEVTHADGLNASKELLDKFRSMGSGRREWLAAA